MRTVQLRRYELKPELVDEFLAWWPTVLVPAREALGYTVGDGAYDPATHEFTWTVSVEGNAAEFARVDAAYMASPEREAAFAGRGPWTNAMHLSFVERVESHPA